MKPNVSGFFGDVHFVVVWVGQGLGFRVLGVWG